MDKKMYKNLISTAQAKAKEYDIAYNEIDEKIERIAIRDKLISQNTDLYNLDLYSEVCNELIIDVQVTVEKLENDKKYYGAKKGYCQDIERALKKEYGDMFEQTKPLLEYRQPQIRK